MRITRRTDYAIHLIADLAASPGVPQGLRSLARKHGVTYAFARTVQKNLLNDGIIKTARGINGGILLVRDLADITLLDIFEAAQEPLDKTFGNEGAQWCGCEDGCILDGVWRSTHEVLKRHFSTITMDKIINKSI
jgi:Rrf2 family protein